MIIRIVIVALIIIIWVQWFIIREKERLLEDIEQALEKIVEEINKENG